MEATNDSAHCYKQGTPSSKRYLSCSKYAKQSINFTLTQGTVKLGLDTVDNKLFTTSLSTTTLYQMYANKVAGTTSSGKYYYLVLPANFKIDGIIGKKLFKSEHHGLKLTTTQISVTLLLYSYGGERAYTLYDYDNTSCDAIIKYDIDGFVTDAYIVSSVSIYFQQNTDWDTSSPSKNLPIGFVAINSSNKSIQANCINTYSIVL